MRWRDTHHTTARRTGPPHYAGRPRVAFILQTPVPCTTLPQSISSFRSSSPVPCALALLLRPPPPSFPSRARSASLVCPHRSPPPALQRPRLRLLGHYCVHAPHGGGEHFTLANWTCLSHSGLGSVLAFFFNGRDGRTRQRIRGRTVRPCSLGTDATGVLALARTRAAGQR